MDVQDVISINCLPDEIIILILQNNSPREILNFGSTCKHYNDMVKNNTLLWKQKCATMFSKCIFTVIKDHHNGQWLKEMKSYSKLEKKLHKELIKMSSVYYWSVSERSLDNVKHFFKIATRRNFFYAINILQDVVKTGYKMIEGYKCIKPYTLTEMYYSKMVLCRFIHTCLAIKWVKSILEQDLSPEIAVNFFLQWIDPENLYFDDDVDKKINGIVDLVITILENDKSVSLKRCNGRQIIEAVSYVIYKQMRMSITSAANLDTLNISKVIDKKCGNIVVVAAIYQTVATRCGASCELIVFPNHLILEWKDHYNPQAPQTYSINIKTGEMYPKKQCPFNNRDGSGVPAKYSYNPEFLIQYIYSSYIATMGALRTWNTQNAILLLEFLGTRNEQNAHKYNPYRNFHSHLAKEVVAVIQCNIVDLKQLSDDHLSLIKSLAYLNKDNEITSKPKIAKARTSPVKFAVGMICYHKKYDYVCIIRAWDLTGCQVHFPLDDLYFGRNQPFYYIVAADQSERYVAQENLMELTRPTRLYHLEHQISKDFTHFDGFAYVLNDQKKLEYPEDQPIVDMFRTICQQKPNN